MKQLTPFKDSTAGFFVLSKSYALHRHANDWPAPIKILSERWLVEEGDPLYPFKGVYRPFEFGPRNCSEQELAMQEPKKFLVMTA